MPLKVLRGCALPWRSLDSNLQGVQDLEVRDDDIFIVSYPKTGTTWIHQIITRMLNCPEEQTKNSISADLSFCFTESEEDMKASPPMYKLLQSWSSPRVILCHLPPHLLPSQLFKTKAKVVYIARNPKDVAVSYYHFFKALIIKEACPPWDEFLQLFMKGEVPYGFCLDHFKQYWEMRGRPNFLFVKYEDLKKDDKSIIKRVGDFLGQELDDKQVASISEVCSVESMRQRFKNDAMPQAVTRLIDQKKSLFVRKGIVGDWRNSEMTEAQSKRFDELCDEHLGGTGLTFSYE